MPPVDRLMLRPTEVAESIGVSRSKVYELINSGEIPSMMVGKTRRVPLDRLREWMDRRLAEANATAVADAPAEGTDRAQA